MALSDLPNQPSFKTITQKFKLNHDETSNKKLPIPLEINLAGRNLKISDYNELISLNNINNDCRRVNTLTIRTVSTYKKKASLLSNNEQPLEVFSKSDKINKKNLINDENKFKEIKDSNALVIGIENNKLNNQKNVCFNKESENFLNYSKSNNLTLNEKVSNKLGYKTKADSSVNEVDFFQSASSLKRQIPENNFDDLNLIKESNLSRSLSTIKLSSNNETKCDDKFISTDNNIKLINKIDKKKMLKNDENEFNYKFYNQNSSAILDQNNFNTKNNKKEFLNNSFENSFNNSFNNSYNSNQFNSKFNYKDGNNNSNLKTSNSSKVLHPHYVTKGNSSNVLNSSSTTLRSIRKVNGEEINCDDFVFELKNKIANNNLQATSSPTIQLKSNMLQSNENNFSNKKNLILDKRTMPILNKNKPSSTLIRNESFQKATKTQFKYMPQTQKKTLEIKNNEFNSSNKTTLDNETLPKQVSLQYNYGISQIANGYCPNQNLNEIANEINDLKLNDTYTTDDWSTTFETTNLETKFFSENTLKKKKCDKYGFFITDDQALNDQIDNFQNKRLKNEIEKRREMKWLEMLNNWDKYMQKKWPKICNRCRKGIPISLRGTAWLYLCAAHKQKKFKPKVFALLDQQIGNELINDEITKDLHRQFPNHEMFAGTNAIGQKDLFKVLKCFSIVKPEIAYCQGQAPLASVLLMHLPVEDAFWCLIQLSDHYLPGYFNPGLETIQMHGQMLNSFLKHYNNNVYKILKKQKIDPNFYMTEWFMCLFARTLPWPTVLRIWDMFFCEGIKIIFRVALVILCSLESDFKKVKNKSNDKLGEILAILKKLPEKYLSEEYLIPKVIEFNLSEKDLESEHLITIKKMKKMKKLTKKK